MIAKGARRRRSNSANYSGARKTETSTGDRSKPAPGNRTEKSRFSPPETGVKPPSFLPSETVSLSRRLSSIADERSVAEPDAAQPDLVVTKPNGTSANGHGNGDGEIELPPFNPTREGIA